MLTDDQVARYARHVLLPEIGGKGQERLLAAGVRVHGEGRAAEECARYLVAAGVGRVVVDRALDAPTLAEQNPDVRVTTEGAADTEIGPLVPAQSRLAGSLAAASVLLELVGRPRVNWQYQTWHGGATPEEAPWRRG